MKIHFALLTAVLAAGCSPQKTDAVDAVATANVTQPDASDMGMSGTEHNNMSDAQWMGMSEEQHARMSSGNTTAAADASAAGTSATATGTVDKVDAAAGTITISHGPVETLNWPAMTMGFKATPEQVASVQAGQDVSFEFTSSGMDATITSIETR